MTKEQAIAILKYNSNVIHQTINGETDPNEVEALDIAIKALEQPNIEVVTIEDVAKELGCQTIKTTTEWLNTLATIEKCGYYYLHSKKEEFEMTKEEIVKLAVENNLVTDVYNTLHYIVIAELEALQDKLDGVNSDLRLIKKFADANKLDVIKDIMPEEGESDEAVN